MDGMRNSERVINDVTVALTYIISDGLESGLQFEQGGARVICRRGDFYNTVLVAVDCESATFTSATTSAVADGNDGVKQAAKHLLDNVVCVVEYLAKEEE